MVETKKARLIHGDGTLTVVLPEDFGLEGDEVYVTHDADSGDVTLHTPRPPVDWPAFLAFCQAHRESDDDYCVFEEALSEAHGRPLYGDH